MTVSTQTAVVEFLENGVTLEFQVPFRFLAASDLIVTRITAGVATTIAPALVTGVGDPGGGTVTLVSSVAASVLRIKRRTARIQQTDYTPGDDFPAESHELALDRQMLALQETDADVADVTARALLAPIGETLGDLPPIAERAGRYFVWDGAGNPRTGTPPTGGLDSALRTDLAAAGGDLLVNAGGARTRDLGHYLSTSALTAIIAGTSAADSSAAFTAAAASLVNGTLDLPRGTIKLAADLGTAKMNIAGAGMDATFLVPFGASDAALTLGNSNNGWNRQRIADLTFKGVAAARTAIGIRFGHAAYQANDEYSGRVDLASLRFQDLDKCVSRPFGSIGTWIGACNFRDANFHLHSIGNLGSGAGGVGDEMHPGCIVAERSHWELADKASVYFDGLLVGGSGQFIFRDNIRENNPGWCHYLKSLRISGGLPSYLIENEWNENNYYAPSVTIDGVTTAPGWLYAFRVDHIVIRNTPVGPMTLIESAVQTEDCNLDLLTSASIDRFSSLVHDRARRLIGPAPGLTRSIGQIQNPNSLNAPSYYMPLPAGVWPFTATVLRVSNAQAVEAWTGTAARATVAVTGDPGLPWQRLAQDFTINAGETELTPANFTVPADRYIVVKYLARLISGPAVGVTVNGAVGIGGQLLIDNAEWRQLTGIFFNTGAAVPNENLYHTAGAATSVIRVGGYSVVSFVTAQQALAYANSGLFPAEDRPAWTLTATTPSRTLDADAAAGTAGATYSQAVLQAALDRTNALEKVVATLAKDLREGRLPK